MKLMKFSMGLDDTYVQIRSSILSREILPDVRSAYATISSEESHRVDFGSITGTSKRFQASAFVSNVSNRENFRRNQTSNNAPRPNNVNNNGQGGGSGIACEDLDLDSLGFNGHTIDRCFKVIGYLVDFEKKKAGQNFKNRNVSNNNIVGSSSSSGFTHEQLSTLISLIKDNSLNGKNVQANIVGANQHMTHTDKKLDNVYDISHLRIKVGYPNGTKSFIFKIRNLKLFNGLVLYDVLVIPEYCVTLNSVHKLAKDNKIFVAFDEGKCVNTDDFSSGNFGNDAQSSDDIFATQDEQEITEVPKDRKAIGSKWVFKIKYKSSGKIDRYKARLVAKGFNQKEVLTLRKIFLDVKMVTVRCLLNLVVLNYWPIFQPDVSNAFLYGDLVEIVYMKPPEGYFPSGDNKSDKGVFVALLVYVDDIVITSNSVSEIEKFKTFLKSKFMIGDLGKLKYFLRIEVIETDQCICLNQTKYVLDLLSKYGMLACKPAKTPLQSKLVNTNEANIDDLLLDNITDYQKLIGKLIYLTNIRLDISYVVHCLSQFMHSPLKSHLKTAFKILRYLKGSSGLRIHITKSLCMSLKAYSDAE
ncbi:ribonuclease H-like domain-containing protein [Tanacetum coccineum]|uniref:Ribonuclease H-like domain-containing protein n=1 Tax=Tanacetum coccineum TaxID=301880 RepID=A0ABQ5ATH6_9ASTR